MEQITEIFYPAGGEHLHASLLLLLARALGTISKDQAVFAEVIEMTYFAHTLHNSVKASDTTADSSLGVLLSNKAMILGGDFMIGNASIECCRIGRIELVQLLSFIIMNISKGYCADITQGDVPSLVKQHCDILYYRTANLFANGCQGIALLGKGDQRSAFDFGYHFGMAFSLCAELKELFTGKIPVTSFPLLYASQRYPKLLKGQVQEEKVRNIIVESQGLNWTRNLVLRHIEAANSILSRFPQAEGVDGLRTLTLRLLSSLHIS